MEGGDGRARRRSSSGGAQPSPAHAWKPPPQQGTADVQRAARWAAMRREAAARTMPPRRREVVPHGGVSNAAAAAAAAAAEPMRSQGSPKKPQPPGGLQIGPDRNASHRRRESSKVRFVGEPQDSTELPQESSEEPSQDDKYVEWFGPPGENRQPALGSLCDYYSPERRFGMTNPPYNNEVRKDLIAYLESQGIEPFAVTKRQLPSCGRRKPCEAPPEGSENNSANSSQVISTASPFGGRHRAAPSKGSSLQANRRKPGTLPAWLVEMRKMQQEKRPVVLPSDLEMKWCSRQLQLQSREHQHSLERMEVDPNTGMSLNMSRWWVLHAGPPSPTSSGRQSGNGKRSSSLPQAGLAGEHPNKGAAAKQLKALMNQLGTSGERLRKQRELHEMMLEGRHRWSVKPPTGQRTEEAEAKSPAGGDFASRLKGSVFGAILGGSEPLANSGPQSPKASFSMDTADSLPRSLSRGMSRSMARTSVSPPKARRSKPKPPKDLWSEMSKIPPPVPSPTRLQELARVAQHSGAYRLQALADVANVSVLTGERLPDAFELPLSERPEQFLRQESLGFPPSPRLLGDPSAARPLPVLHWGRSGSTPTLMEATPNF